MGTLGTTADRTYRILVTAVFALLCLAVLVPLAWVVLASVKAKSEFYGNPWTLPKGLHLENFVGAVVNANMGAYFLNSVIVTILAIAICLTVAVPAAYAIARFEFTGKRVVETYLMAGLFINVNYIVVPIFLMVLGWDQTLKAFFPKAYLLDNIFVLALIYAATSLPFTIFLLTTYFRTIPKIYEEAAAIDGASRWRTMRSVILPMALPAINTSILFNFLYYWNDFILALTLMRGDNRTLQVGLLNLFQTQRAAADYGQLYAGMVIVMAPVLIVYALVQKRLLQGVGQGGLKE